MPRMRRNMSLQQGITFSPHLPIADGRSPVERARSNDPFSGPAPDRSYRAPSESNPQMASRSPIAFQHHRSPAALPDGASGNRTTPLAAQHAINHTAHPANQTLKRHRDLQSPYSHVPITGGALQRIGLGWTVGFEPTNTRATTWRLRPLGDAHRGRPPRSGASRLGMASRPVNRTPCLKRSLSARAVPERTSRRFKAAAR